ncbi:MAG: hypothetical protein ABJN42_04840 [Roseibium sp.]|uniref:hypothetical protein n=1 Tax=Roseibium sp. TaxID=1936156 RepID=UPI00329801C4
MTRTREENAADLAREEEAKEQRLANVAETFGEPVLSSDNGDWYAIENADQARLATQLSETAVGHFWNMGRRNLESSSKGDSHDWLILLDEGGEALVAMAALKEGAENLHGSIGLTECHVTGFQNNSAWPDYQDDIEAVASERGLISYPNHMGARPPEPDDGPSL